MFLCQWNFSFCFCLSKFIYFQNHLYNTNKWWFFFSFVTIENELCQKSVTNMTSNALFNIIFSQWFISVVGDWNVQAFFGLQFKNSFSFVRHIHMSSLINNNFPLSSKYGFTNRARYCRFGSMYPRLKNSGVVQSCCVVPCKVLHPIFEPQWSQQVFALGW